MEKFLRAITPFILIALLIGGALYYDVDILGVANQFKDFMLGGINIHEGLTNVSDILGDVTGVIILAILLVLVVSLFVSHFLGKPRSFIITFDEDVSPITVFAMIFGEELLARWLFLGLLTQILPGTVCFFILMIIGNLVWSLLHLANYEDKDERHPLRVLPQFLAGFFFAFLFVKYGFFVAVLAHFTFDAVLFSTGKCNEISGKDFFYLAYHGILLLVGYFVISGKGIGLSNLEPWLTSSTLSPLEGFHFWDYFFILLFFSSLIHFISSVLFMDVPEEQNDDVPFLGLVMILLAMAPLFVLGVYLINWIIGWFSANILFKVLVLTVLMTLIGKPGSLSSLSRSWLTGLPVYYIIFAAVIALDFWTATGLLAMQFLLALPIEFSRRL